MAEPTPSGHDIIVIGASAGGLQGVVEIVRGLPADLPAAVFVVIHTSPNNPGILPQIIDRAGPLTAVQAMDGDAIEHGRIYVAPPDHHLIIKPRHIRVPRGPQENGFRPAVDPLFRTAAKTYGNRVVGIVLSGGLDDGTYGLSLIKERGGKAIVQDPQEAIVPSMPLSAVKNVEVDYVLRVAEIADRIISLTTTTVNGADAMAEHRDEDQDVAEGGMDALQSGIMPHPPSSYTCPACGGALWEMDSPKIVRFRCHVGHGYTGETLLAAQSDGLETALWSAIRALEENAALRRKMAERSHNSGLEGLAAGYERQAEQAEQRAEQIRMLVTAKQEEPARGQSGQAAGA